MIKPGDIQILKRDDKLNAVCVYNTVTDKNKPAQQKKNRINKKWILFFRQSLLISI
jgi:hypothetical protein